MLQRSVRKELETPMARELLSGTFKDGDDVLVDVVNDRITLRLDEDTPSLPPLVSSSPADGSGSAGALS